MVQIDTAALSIWVDHKCFIEHGGMILSKRGAVCAEDGSDFGVIGSGQFKCVFWVLEFVEDVRIMSTLPDKILIGRKFSRKVCLQNSASVRHEGDLQSIQGIIWRRGRSSSHRRF